MDVPTGAALEALRERLLNLRTELEQLLEMSADGAKPVSLDQPIGRLSRVDALQQQAMIQASRREIEVRLAHVRLALRRMEDDDYGPCRRCEDPIAAARLEARPEAPFCAECQEGIDTQR